MEWNEEYEWSLPIVPLHVAIETANRFKEQERDRIAVDYTRYYMNLEPSILEENIKKEIRIRSAFDFRKFVHQIMRGYRDNDILMDARKRKRTILEAVEELYHTPKRKRDQEEMEQLHKLLKGGTDWYSSFLFRGFAFKDYHQAKFSANYIDEHIRKYIHEK
ncbi:MAG: hypothetical protein KC535_01985 [Nanoarchaeota archaeon]|nr:hypothetical protein [Nanoarchaeota archaeon]